jgi:hypothetical protein
VLDLPLGQLGWEQDDPSVLLELDRPSVLSVLDLPLVLLEQEQEQEQEHF